MSSEQLIPIDKIIRLAREAEVTFGFGNPRVHLAYLAKLHLIPPAIRRKTTDGRVAGCYSESVINTLIKIENLKNQGLNYSQIKAQLNTINSSLQVQANKFNLALAFSGPVFLFMGVVIGYLLATTSNNSRQLPIAVLPENDYQKVLRSAPLSNDNQTIYVTSGPNQTLYKLGGIDLTSLTN